jgi:hypothetical protein
MAARSRARSTLGWAALAAGTWIAIEALCAGALFAVAQMRGIPVPSATPFRLAPEPRARLERILAGREPYYPFDPELGWTVRPGGRLPLYRANSQGIRADSDYALLPPPGAFRLAAFGDSFVHGTEVANADAWPARLAALRGDLEVLNFGVGGYGVDQAYLRWRRDGRPFHPHVVLIGFLSEDIHRSVNRFRPFQAPRHFEPRAKPRFALRGGGLELLPNPLPDLDAYRELLAREPEVIERIGRDDAFYESLWEPHPLSFLPSARLARWARAAWSPQRTIAAGRFNPRSEAFEVTARVIELFADGALAEGSLPLVVLLPTREDLERASERGNAAWAPLGERLERGGIATLDVLDCFARLRPRPAFVFMKGGHYGPATNALVARCLFDALDARTWLSRAGIDRALAQARAARAAGRGALQKRPAVSSRAGSGAPSSLPAGRPTLTGWGWLPTPPSERFPRATGRSAAP